MHMTKIPCVLGKLTLSKDTLIFETERNLTNHKVRLRTKKLSNFLTVSPVLTFSRSAVLQYGMWDQIRVDHGKEFYLTLFMQEKLASFRNNTARQPYLQTSSTHVSCPIVLLC